jgi:hypothetical protein
MEPLSAPIRKVGARRFQRFGFNTQRWSFIYKVGLKTNKSLRHFDMDILTMAETDILESQIGVIFRRIWPSLGSIVSRLPIYI